MKNPVHQTSSLTIRHNDVQIVVIMESFDETQDMSVISKPLHSLNLLEGIFISALLQIFHDGRFGQPFDSYLLRHFFGGKMIDALLYSWQDDSKIYHPPSWVMVAKVNRWYLLYPHVGVRHLFWIFVHDIYRHNAHTTRVKIEGIFATLLVSSKVVGRKDDKILGISDALVYHNFPELVFIEGRLVCDHYSFTVADAREYTRLSGTKRLDDRQGCLIATSIVFAFYVDVTPQ
mmetsp:Transcript_15879/g.36755  ORF Transcript_15879/g.36755 Transcript_15879/m.36755 type:complete len:232 (+) Transcript_15879:268-963(+)